MKFFESEMNVFYDCDDTLVMWHDEPCDIIIKDPYEEGISHNLKKHKKHIKLLKTHKAQGYGVVVWSAGGAKWAQSVVDALELNDHVDIIMAKPVKFIDDLTANEIMGTRVYLKDEE